MKNRIQLTAAAFTLLFASLSGIAQAAPDGAYAAAVQASFTDLTQIARVDSVKFGV